ncbi:MAG: SsrA-binding protein SmpB [Cytophagales bacterium]|nr:MAG: SsrA-binding protein SmpB [Cytophagales bacterium]TAF59478.1 MAG: SsrA-binding protein SmpB [Cytophagales bacterium]
MSTPKKSDIQKFVSIQNRKAAHEFHFIDKYSAGVVLKGTEIKSIRQGKVNMQDAFCLFLNNELFVRNLHISEYERGNIHNHNPKIDRKLLLTKRELNKLNKALDESGMTIVPTRVFISEKGWAKVDIALARGKRLYDKRETLKEKDAQRELDRYHN